MKKISKKSKVKLARHTSNYRQSTHKLSIFLKPLIIIGAITLGAMTWYSFPRPQTSNINLVGQSTGTVSLALTPTSINLTPNTEATITLTIAAGTSHVTSTRVEILYDSSKIGIPTVTLGDFLPVVFSSVKTDDNKITFSVVTPPETGGKTGDGTLATIKIKPTMIGESSLIFGESTMITATELITGNSLKSANNVTITIANPVASSVASANPSTAASVSPSTSASVSPSTVASPEQPNKPTGLRSNCYENGDKITLRWDSVTGADSYKVRMDQKDGNNDKAVEGVTKTEYEFNIIAGQNYAWWVHATKSGVDSEEARIEQIVCNKTIAAATATPAPTATPTPATPKPTIKSTSTPIPTPIPALAPTSTPGISIASPIPTGSLNDIFANPEDIAPLAETSSRDLTVWQKILNWLTSIFE